MTPDKRCMLYHKNKQILADNIDDLKAAVALFDKEPKAVVWLNEA